MAKYVCELCGYESEEQGECPTCEIALEEVSEEAEEEKKCKHGLSKDDCEICSEI